MSEEVQRRALEPFYTTKDVGRGTGLGLSMAFGMAQQSGGALRIQSQPGAGTTITIILRKASATEVPVHHDSIGSEDTDLPRATRHGIEVMIVDDDDDVRRVMTETLRGLGYAAPSYSNGEAALRVMQQKRPDLLVLDFAMPDMNGAEVARQVRAVYPDLYIIFVSGFADSAKLDEVMDDRSVMLRKPFDADDLARLVAACLAVSDGGSQLSPTV
jgi:CheY-like chemotaxis protein